MTSRARKRWRLKPCDAQAAAALAEAVGCSRTAAQLLRNRGIDTPEAAHAFLNPSLSDLPDPFLLPDAEAAAERIKQALHRGERIAIHGDYDGDGITSAALWTRALEKLGARVMVHVPHRHRDGYDMRSAFVAHARSEGAGLIITTDCGIRRADEVEEAREAGIDVVVTDHHIPDEQIPRAAAVVNPNRRDSRYPFRELAGVGVAFRACEALVRHLGHSVDSYRRAFIEYAAVGTITDMMPLLGENRVIVTHGLSALRHTRKPGFRALLSVAGIAPATLDARSIGFGIGPRINAIGRIDDARLALDLLLARDEAQAQALAAKLEQANTNRRAEQDRVLAEALEAIASRNLASESCLVVSGTSWHSGVIGLVANKLVEKYHRPIILIAIDERTGMARGSARSIDAFDMLAAITTCAEHLEEFGGHAHAAGLSIRADSLPGFQQAVARVAAEALTPEDLVPAIDADLEVPIQELTVSLLRELDRFQPWGAGNEEPVFVSRRLEVREVLRVGKEQQHLKLRFAEPAAGALAGLRWNCGDQAEHIHPGDVVDICYRPRIDNYDGSLSIVLNVEDLHAVRGPGA